MSEAGWGRAATSVAGVEQAATSEAVLGQIAASGAHQASMSEAAAGAQQASPSLAEQGQAAEPSAERKRGPVDLALEGPVVEGLLDSLIKHPPRDNLVADKYDLDITMAKITCLRDGVWLNSEVITFWLEWWCEQVGAGSQGREPTLTSNPKCWFANTYFFSRLTEDGSYNYTAVRRWTDRVDVFSLDKVIIPINVNDEHWFLAVIDFRTKKTQVFDSMGSIHADVHNTLHRWLQDEHRNKHGSELDSAEWGRQLNGAYAVPRQLNGCDCGVFTCLFAAYASLDLPFTFGQQHIPLIRRWMVQIIYNIGAATGPTMSAAGSGACSEQVLVAGGFDEPVPRQLFTRTLPNIGNTCFFNSVMQVLASIPKFVTAIAAQILSPDLAGTSFCIAFLKLFIPAIAQPSAEPSVVLDITSVRHGELNMSLEDWADFVRRLTIKHDAGYDIGKYADPSDLLEHLLSIVPEVDHMCAVDSTSRISFPCACSKVPSREKPERDLGISIVVNSGAPLPHHILHYFAQENVDYQCDSCGLRASDAHPARKQRFLLSLPRFLRITITAPRTVANLPQDHHQHGPLREYESLDLSQLAPHLTPEQGRYTLRAAIMYSRRHHWTYLHGQPSVYISDDVSRVATSDDIQAVATCARVLVYEQDPPLAASPASCNSHVGLDASHSTRPQHSVIPCPPSGELGTARLIQSVWQSTEERITRPLDSASVEALSDPLFGLRARLECYNELAKQATQSESPLLTALQELQIFADKLSSQFSATLSAVPAEECAETARLFCDDASARVRHLLWSAEWELHTVIREQYDSTLLPQLDDVLETERVYNAISHLMPPGSGAYVRRRLLILNGLRSMCEHLSKVDCEDLERSRTCEGAARHRVMSNQDVIRCTLTPEFQRVAKATQHNITAGQRGRADADDYLQSADIMIRTHIRENQAVAAAVWSLGPTKYQDTFERMNYSASVGLSGTSTRAGGDAMHRCCTGSGGRMKRASEACEQMERNLKLTRAQTGVIGRGTTQELRKQPPPPSHKPSSVRGSEAQRQGVGASPSRRTLGDFFSTAQWQSAPTPTPLDVPKVVSLTAVQDRLPVPKSVVERGAERPLHPEIELGTRSVKGSSTSVPPNLSLPARTSVYAPALARLPPQIADRRIVVKGAIPGASPWTPGTQGLYPRPIGAQRSDVQATSFPVWNTRVRGLGWQQAMFNAADSIEQSARAAATTQCGLGQPSTFYVAADVWTRKSGEGWGLGKTFGAFESPHAFVTQLLEVAHNRCFYEIIRADRACKALHLACGIR